LEKKFWDTLCDVLQRPDLKACHWSLNAQRAHAKQALESIFSGHTQAYWVEKFRDADCCVTPVLTLEESLEDPQIAARGMIMRAPHPRAGQTLQFAPPLQMSEFAFAIERPAPDAGEHTDEVLSESGYSRDEITRLREAGVV
ncbi:MAG: CoA transferase, partial [Burkholderiales bacterium]